MRITENRLRRLIRQVISETYDPYDRRYSQDDIDDMMGRGQKIPQGLVGKIRPRSPLQSGYNVDTKIILNILELNPQDEMEARKLLSSELKKIKEEHPEEQFPRDRLDYLLDRIIGSGA